MRVDLASKTHMDQPAWHMVHGARMVFEAWGASRKAGACLPTSRRESHMAFQAHARGMSLIEIAGMSGYYYEDSQGFLRNAVDLRAIR